MRMARHVSDPRRAFRGAEAARHDGHIGPEQGPKKPVNVSVDADVLKVAKEMGINLSRVLEDALRAATEEERIRRWQEENKPFTDSYNAYIERNGVAGEELLDLDDPSV
jgi:antitoxin CcdA